jgi:pimeloyl-ACP methyl ester carboxylesterase
MSGALQWAAKEDLSQGSSYGLFGSSTGSAAAIATAARIAEGELREAPKVAAIVSRGGRPDMAEESIPKVTAPTLLIVGGRDLQVLQMHHEIFDLFEAEAILEIVEGASHLFEEPGALEQVADLAVDWFSTRL